MANRSSVVIIGAGVAGASCALELARRGVDVTVIDKRGIGHGCSYGNAGWITPCFAMPLPMPGMFWKSLGWLISPESPLYIKPEPSWLLLRWLTRFLLSMNTSQMQRAVSVLTGVSIYSLDAYQKLDREFPGRIQFTKQGLLMVGNTRGGVRAAEEEMQLVSARGIPGRSLKVDEIRALEPALTGKLEGGVYFPEEAHAEPLAVVQTLAHAAERAGAKFATQTELLRFHWQGNRIRAVETTKGEFSADVFVLAAGTWSTRLSEQLPVKLPILGGKGYSLIVPDFAPKPKIPMMLVEKKIAVTPRADSVRIAGTLELVNQDFSITQRRVDAIRRGAREYLPLPQDIQVRELWRGLRPCTPDGVPAVGLSRRAPNLCFLTGHQMLGLQSAPGTARLAADLILGEKPLWDPAPFDPDRF